MSILLSVIAGLNVSSSSVSATGTEFHVIQDLEREAFGIGTDNQLKNAVATYFGKRPDDAYLHSNTPWGDLYKVYNWPQVQTHFMVKNASVTEISSEPVIIATKTFINQSSQTATFNAAISDTVTNTVESNWTNSNKFTVGYSIKGSLTIPGVGGLESGYTFGFDHTWGQGGSTSYTSTVGSTTGVLVTLDPGESVVAELTATRGKMKVRVNYDTYLTGIAAVNYSNPYQGHHFWGLPIGEVVRAAGKQNSNIVTEDLEFGYYSDAQVIVKDRNGREKRTINASF